MKDRHELWVDRFFKELDVKVPWNPEIPEAERQGREKELRAMWLDFLREDELDRTVPWTPELRASFAETYKKLIELGCDAKEVRGSLIAGMGAAWRAACARSDPPAPNWNDERAVADWVAIRPLRLVPVYNVNSKEERHRLAIEDAKAGNFYALEDMIRSGERLSAEARELIADNLGKYRKQPDPRKQTHEKSVKPDAERAFVEIEHRLKRGFPKQSNRNIKDRAFALAAERFNMNEESLREYVRRSAGHKRRLSPKPKIR